MHLAQSGRVPPAAMVLADGIYRAGFNPNAPFLDGSGHSVYDLPAAERAPELRCYTGDQWRDITNNAQVAGMLLSRRLSRIQITLCCLAGEGLEGHEGHGKGYVPRLSAWGRIRRAQNA